MKNNGDILKRPSTFWIMIAGALISGSVAFATLSVKVSALESMTIDKGAKLRQEVENNDSKLEEINSRLIRIETNQLLIMKSFNLEPAIE